MGQIDTEIIKIVGDDKVKFNEPLARHTTFKIGGPTDIFVEVESEKKLIELIKLIKENGLPYFILGNGSKVLAADEGFRGVVIAIRNTKYVIRNTRITAGAGMAISDLLNKLVKAGLSGLEFMAGIPGTLGGAIRGNAGAWQKNIGDKVLGVRVLDENGQVKELSQEECRFEYRNSRFKSTQEIILSVDLQMAKGDPQKIKAQIDQYLSQRQGQPTEPSVGSIFVNPKPQAAGDLIEKCGLKGAQIGQAQISPKHANFIVNLGGAKASEVIKLIELIRGQVKQNFGVELKEEVVLLGFNK